MASRAGAFCASLLIAILGTGCRSVWVEPSAALRAAPRELAWRPIGDSAVQAILAGGADSAAATDAAFASVLAEWNALNAAGLAVAEASGATEAYHASVARFLAAACDDGRLLPGQGVILSSAAGPMLVPFLLRSSVWHAADVQSIHLVGEYRVPELSRRYRNPGAGVPVVVERAAPTGAYAEESFITPGVAFAATTLVRPQPGGGVAIELFDPLHPAACAAPPVAPLAADLSAPFAFRLVNSPEIRSDWLSFFGVDAPTREGLFFLEPYQRGKIPVVMVHGILSNPAAWVDLANDLRAVSGFADKYQLWAFRYNTNAPFLAAASRLRSDLYQAVATVDPAGQDPALEQLTLVGHSMGGLVCELQAAASEDRLWNAVANRPLPMIVADATTRSSLQEMFFFAPQPNVRCVISIAAPHQGSTLAARPVGQLGRLLAEQEPERAARHAELVQNNPGVFTDEITRRVPTSIDMLNPDSAVLQAIESLPTNPTVEYHTVFGYGRTRLGSGPGDGIVAVDSALSPRAVTQVGIEASHTKVHRTPECAAEIVRILNARAARFAWGAVPVE